MDTRSRTRPLLEWIAMGLLVAGIGVHLLFLLSLRYGGLNGLFNDTMHRFGPGGDFFSIYAAGIKARHGESLYTVGGHVAEVPYAYAFRYAPIVAYTLGAALTLLPAINAYGLWLILCEFALLRNIRLCVERAPNRATACLAAALWLLFSPYYLELYVGQFTFLTASLVFWALLGWEKGASRRSQSMASLFFALAVLLKMMPLLYLPLLLWRGKIRTALATLAVLLATSGLYFWHRPTDWALFMDVNGDPMPTWHAGNQGLMALLYALCNEQQPAFAQARLLALLLVATGLLYLIQRLNAQRPTPNAPTPNASSLFPLPSSLEISLPLYAACSAAYLLLYKDVWEHHYLILLPPLVLMAMRREAVWLWLPPYLLCALPGLFALYDVHGLGYNEDPQRYWLPAVSVLHHAIKPLAPLWLFGGLLLKQAQTSQQGEGGKGTDAGALGVGRWALGVEKRKLLPITRLLLATLAAVICCRVGLWAHESIVAQRRVSHRLTLSDSVFQLQHTPLTCGPAALAAVCRYYGIAATEEEIARLAETDSHGTSMLGLQRAAQAKGLTAEGQERRIAELASLPRPCILYFHRGHFALLTGVQGDRYYVADPSLGQRIWTRAQLAYLWRGELLLVGPGK